MTRLAEILVRYKTSFFVTAILIVTSALLFLPLPEFSGDVSGFDLENNERFETFKKTNELFGTDSKVFMQVVPASNDRQELHRSVDSLSSLITQKYPDSKIISPMFYYGKMLRHWKNKNNDLLGFLNEASEVPVLNQLIAKDKKSFLVVATMKSPESIDADFFYQLNSTKLKGIKTIRSISSGHINSSIEHHIAKDFIRLTLIILGFFILYILLTYRSLRAIIFAGFIILIPIAVSLLLFDLLGMNMNIISVLVLPIVLILALSDALHLMSGYVRFGYIANKNERLIKVVSHYFIPSFFSSATTAAAFYSFYWFNGSSYIQEFGIVTAIALMIEFVISFSIAPLLLHLLNPSNVYDKEISSISTFLFKHRKLVSYVSILILVISFFFVSKLSIRSNAEIFFPRNSEIQRTHDEFMKNFYASINLNVIVKAKGERQYENDPTFNYVKELSQKLEERPEVTSVVSATDQFMFKSKMGVSVNLFGNLGENNPYYNEDNNTYRIEVHFPSGNEINAFCRDQIQALIKSPPDGIEVSYSSLAILMEEVNGSVSRSLIQSLSTSGIFIFLMILLLTRSLSASFMSLVPNIIPLAVLVLIYYFAGIHLNIITALSAVICLGLLDDDTVHILYRKLWLKEELDELSFSILSSAIILSICFSFFLISSFQPVRTFGWVSALIFVIGVICELTLMQWVIEIVLNRLKSKKEG